ncbi:MAG: MFS transporter, partial [Carboxydocellales bacterium]
MGKLSKNILALGVVSLLTDLSSEMLTPVLPLFLANVLKVDKSIIGLIEGIAESTASLLKVYSGWLSDRISARKPLIFAGYGLSALAKPILLLATGWPTILGYRFVDRIGKGLRSSPRDAIIADSIAETDRG